MKRDILVIAFCIAGLLGVQEARADQFEDYFQEEIPYVFAYGKPFPEITAFTCVNNNLRKGIRYVRDYKGAHVKCEFKTLTRQEYEDLNNVTRTF